MKKPLLLLTFFLAAISALSPRLSSRFNEKIKGLKFSYDFVEHPKSSGAGVEVVAFIEGFAEGLGADFGNVTECTSDVNMTLANFESGYHYVIRGIEKFSPRDISNGLKSWGQGLSDARLAIVQCGTQDLVNDIDKIISDFQSEIEFALEELENIFKHRTTLKEDFESAEAAFEKKNFYQVGFNTGKIVGILIEA